MKKILFLLSVLFCTTVFAQTINWHVGDSIIRTDTCSSGDSVTPPTAPAKTGYHFAEWLEYQPIEYLESTGTQWIDTGIKPNQNIRVMIKFKCESGYVFGGRNGAVSAEFDFLISNNSNLIQYNFGSNRINATNISSVWFDFVLILDQGKNGAILINEGETIRNQTSFGAQSFQTNYNMIVFGLNNAGNIIPSIEKIYYFKLYDNDILVRDLVPALDTNDIPGMYDKVTKRFFYNAGTGDFIAGPVIQ